MVIGFLQCLVVLSVEGLVDVKDWKQNQKKGGKKAQRKQLASSMKPLKPVTIAWRCHRMQGLLSLWQYLLQGRNPGFCCTFKQATSLKTF